MNEEQKMEQVLDLILESNIELKFLHWGHVEKGFKAYQAVSQGL